MTNRTAAQPAEAPSFGTAVDNLFDRLRRARWDAVSADYETRVAAYFDCEDIAAELTALLDSTDARTI